MSDPSRPVTATGFDPAMVFDDDFAHFYADRVGTARTERELALLTSIADLAIGETVLDLCCGQGRIANALAGGTGRVVGLDVSLAYLTHAAALAESGPDAARYVLGDMRSLPFAQAFDLVVCWYTSFGYFDDDTNRALLHEIRAALHPGGRLVLDLDGKEHLVASGLPTQVRERGADLMVEQFHYDPSTGRVEARRTVVREQVVRRTSYFVRVFAAEELRDWLTVAGFDDVQVFGEDGEAFRPGGRRMVLRARRH